MADRRSYVVGAGLALGLLGLIALALVLVVVRRGTPPPGPLGRLAAIETTLGVGVEPGSPVTYGIPLRSDGTVCAACMTGALQGRSVTGSAHRPGAPP